HRADRPERHLRVAAELVAGHAAPAGTRGRRLRTGHRRRAGAAPMTAPILRTEGLVKRFGGLLATDHVSIDVVPGEVHALIGPHGAGQSTLITLLSGERRPDAGSILLDQAPVTRLDVVGRARAGLGRSYQITQVLMEFTALDNVLVSILARSRETGAWKPLRAATRHVEAALHYLEQVGLGGRAEVPVTEMAHGERRQLELA